jgi:hypothetical protein
MATDSSLRITLLSPKRTASGQGRNLQPHEHESKIKLRREPAQPGSWPQHLHSVGLHLAAISALNHPYTSQARQTCKAGEKPKPHTRDSNLQAVTEDGERSRW